MPSTSSSCPTQTRLTILISGNGTNLQALIDASSTSKLPATTIVRVISNRRGAFGLERAEKANIPTAYHNLVAYKKRHETEQLARAEYDRDLATMILADAPDLVVCAGWMHILTPRFLDPLAAARIPVINLHPALPGCFDGANAIQRAHQAWERGEIEQTGVMVHYVVAEVDRGEPICVREIDMISKETLEQLEERIHKVEWEIIVDGTKSAIERLWKEKGR